MILLYIGGEDLERVQLDREKSEQIFYRIRDLGMFFTQNLNSAVQNPDFAAMEDLGRFKKDCARFEEEYENIKKEVEGLFSSATS